MTCEYNAIIITMKTPFDSALIESIGVAYVLAIAARIQT